jgi:hypothetical protein
MSRVVSGAKISNEGLRGVRVGMLRLRQDEREALILAEFSMTERKSIAGGDC